MASGVNKVFLLGNLGKDPEVQQTKSGSTVCKFSLATADRRKQGDQWVDHTEWHNIVVFGKSAENCGKYLAKGSKAYIEGRIQTQKWEGRDGNTRYTTEIFASDVQFLGSAKTPGAYAGGDAHAETPFDPNDDVPF